MATEGGAVFWLRKDDDGKVYPAFGNIQSGSLAPHGTPLLPSSQQDWRDLHSDPPKIDNVGLLTRVEEKLTAELARVGELKRKAILNRNAEAASGGGRTRKNKLRRKKATRHRK
jgi:hypothetical protein